MTFEQIKELVELVAKHHLSALELERSGFRLRVDGEARQAAPATVPVALPTAQPVADASLPAAPAVSMAASAPTPAPTQTAESTEAEEGSDDLPPGAHILTSPIVGTFYRRPNPDADTFCEVGDRVKEGQVLCIVEAMKLMNEIEADVDGEILKIFPKNAQPVEFGEPLFAIKAS